MGQRLRRFALDLSPLRVSRDFRLLWAGAAISATGHQFTRVAIYIQVYALTGSPAAVGVTGLTGLAALVVGVIVAGSFIDAHDRRKVLIWAQAAYAISSVVLVLAALAGHPSVLIIYGANAWASFVQAFDSPARQAMTPRLIGKRLIPSALTLNQVMWQAVSVIGPGIGGFVIARFGLAWAYGVDLIGIGIALFATAAMHAVPPEGEPAHATGITAIREGFGYATKERLIASTFVIDLVAMIFGLPIALFPVLAVTQFHRGPAVVGLLLAAPSAGALIQAIASGWVGRVRRQGEVIIWSVIGWGAAITAFGLVGHNLVWALIFLAIAGGADVISAIFRSTILQLTIPDRLRGRLQAIFTLVVTGGPRMGDFEAGAIAQIFTPTISVVSGGLLCIVGAGIVAWLYPELRRFRAEG